MCGTFIQNIEYPIQGSCGVACAGQPVSIPVYF
mgnify:CR=1 FL=1